MGLCLKLYNSKSFFAVYKRMKEFPFLKKLKQPQLFFTVSTCLSMHKPSVFFPPFSTAVKAYLKLPREALCLCSSKMPSRSFERIFQLQSQCKESGLHPVIYVDMFDSERWNEGIGLYVRLAIGSQVQFNLICCWRMTWLFAG